MQSMCAHPLAATNDVAMTSLPRPCDVEALGDAIAVLAARLHAATYELLVLLRQFDAATGWNTGFLSCAHWLSWRTGIDLGAAREKVRVARALANLPRISAAMAGGELSYAKVRALTRIATSSNEPQLLDVARTGTASQVERVVRAWRRVDRIADAQEAERRHLNRQVVTWIDDDGMIVIRGRLTPEVGAVVERALDAATDRLWKDSQQAQDDGRVQDEVTAGQRRADALGLLAECALGGELDGGSAGDRYQVVVHVEAPVQLPGPTGDAVAEFGNGQSAVELEGGPVHVSAQTSQRLACDASVLAVRYGTDGTVLDVVRKTRTIPAAIRRALEARDRSCQFPGCTARRCDGHHIRHWAHGGPTRLDNLVRLCRRHHRAVHEGRFAVARHADGALTFLGPDGARILPSPPMPIWSEPEDPEPLAPTVRRLTQERAAVTPSTCTPRWDGERLDVGWAIDVLRGNAAAEP
jgi:hypothetical protein